MNAALNAQLELLCPRLDALLAQNGPVIVAIDGLCTAGKTTLAAALGQRYDCNIFHMDDFFLRPEQRTEPRLAQPGGNVDYERFAKAVLEPLKTGLPFSYRPFSCKTMALNDAVDVVPKKLNIVEGTYSRHPFFRDPYHLRVFLTISPQAQAKRILDRPTHLQEKFINLWIPMENTYFQSFQIEKTSDLILAAE